MKWLALALVVLVSPVSPAGAVTSDQIHWCVISPTEVSFAWRGTDLRLFWGTQSGIYFNQVFGVAPLSVPDGTGPFKLARVTGLVPGKLYYYRVGGGLEHTFRAPPPRGSNDFWFGEEADVGSSLSYPQVSATQDSMAVDEAMVPGDDRPAFVLVAGDLTYGDQNSFADVDRHFNDVMAWSLNAAYMPAWGNHEWDPAGSLLPDQVNDYKGRFDLPNPRQSPGTGEGCIEDDFSPGQDWYWFDYGSVRFIARPPSSEGTCGYVGARQAWRLAADSLMSAVDNDPEIRFVITYGHFPTFSSGADHGGDGALAADMAALRNAHPKYVLNIAAHSHHYERFNPTQTGGLQHVIGAGGGSSLGGLASSPLPSTLARWNHLEHLKIHVNGDRIEGYCVCGPHRSEESESCVPGTVIDTWTVLAGGTTSVPPSVRPALPVRAGWYDVQGRRVEPGAAGAYFRPGKPRTIIK